MDIIDRKAHWNNIYKIKNTDQVSWYQATPVTSLNFVKQFNLSMSARIIDIGGGDSFFVDHLLDMGYRDITVLDISEKAIGKAKQRTGEQANKVKWIIADAVEFNPLEKYDFWHDRAAFHFLTDDKDIEKYVEIVSTNIIPAGYLVIGTFSDKGPEKCSGLNIKQYSERTMTELLKVHFEKLECMQIDHNTPSGSIQHFIFCSFRRK
jgi:2-polyprenyl-3-methyl-5-hydroxy-6-metoxy-1,4-benzoquinol methylase